MVVIYCTSKKYGVKYRFKIKVDDSWGLRVWGSWVIRLTFVSFVVKILIPPKSYIMTEELKINIAPGMVLSSVHYAAKNPVIFREASFALHGHNPLRQILKYHWS